MGVEITIPSPSYIINFPDNLDRKTSPFYNPIIGQNQSFIHRSIRISDHKIIHIEISTKDRKTLGKFYADVFGWELAQFDDMGYTTFKAGDGVRGGFNPVTAENPAGTVLIYIETDDVTASLNDIQKAGGTIISPEMEIPNTGKFGLFRDPHGNLIGLFKPFPMA